MPASLQSVQSPFLSSYSEVVPAVSYAVERMGDSRTDEFDSPGTAITPRGTASFQQISPCPVGPSRGLTGMAAARRRFH